MPRINIEDSLWSDDRYQELAVLSGSRAMAAGSVLLAIVTAQKHWCPEKRPIPKKEWDRLTLSKEMLQVGLAEEMENSVYLRGSEKHFSWWFSAKEKGRKGGLAKAASAKHKQDLVQHRLPSSSSSSSSSSSNRKGTILSGKPDFEPLCFETLEGLNKALGKNYKAVASNLKHIQSRIKENYTLDEFLKVVEFKKEEWTGTNMEQYLRPETLFGPKFDSYLQTAKAKKEIGNKW
jgi:uncharacterized phage protein (TIGR02220 family)